MDEEVKRDVLESCASDIMFNYERLSEEEKAVFDGQFGDQVGQMMI